MTDSLRCPGMRDLLPGDMERFRRLEDTFRQVCLGWGYGEVRTPTIEHLHLFTAAGTLSPQMLERVYSFLDWDGWSGERVVLRPDSTIPVARLYREQFASAPVTRLFYVQSVLRFAEGDASREDWQCGVELIGDTQPSGDIELILMASEVLSRLGLPAELKLSDPGILRSLFSAAGLDSEKQLALYDRVLDGDLSALDDVQAALPGAGASLAALLALEGENAAYLGNLRTEIGPSISGIDPVLDELASISDVLSHLELAHRIAPVLVRDFEYYTGPVFYLYVDGQKVGGGGRYDALVSVGDRGSPASGFALDMDALMPLLSGLPSAATGLTTVRPKADDTASLRAAFELARSLRAAGVRVEVGDKTLAPGDVQVVASDAGFELRNNGAEPTSLETVDETVRAIAKSSS